MLERPRRAAPLSLIGTVAATLTRSAGSAQVGAKLARGETETAMQDTPISSAGYDDA
jgi:hypothetical protein